MNWRQALRRAPRILSKSVFANLLPADLFNPQLDLNASRKLFSQFVRMVEIENHSYCNRTCWFCPNAQLDRRSSNTLMRSAVYEKILADLKSIDYSQTFSWSRYHEPFAHDSIYDRIGLARRALPRAHLLVISNGDYLNRDSLRRLEDVGLDRMMLDLYLPEGKERDQSEIRGALDKFASRTGLNLTPIGAYDYYCEGTRVHVTMGIPFYSATNMSTRGGLVRIQELDHFQRTAVCFNPVHSVTVDYNGKCVLCCQVRSDSPHHRDAIFGDLTDDRYSLFHFYRDLARARHGLVSPGPKLGACTTCTISGLGPNRLARRKTIASLAAFLPGVQPVFRAALKRASHRRKYEVA